MFKIKPILNTGILNRYRSGNQSFIHIFDPDKPWDIYR